MHSVGAETDRSISTVLADIGRNAQELLRSEIRLAQSDARAQLLRARPAGVRFAVGAGAALLAAFFLVLALLFALRRVMPDWAAAVCVGAALALAAAIALNSALRQLRLR